MMNFKVVLNRTTIALSVILLAAGPSYRNEFLMTRIIGRTMFKIPGSLLIGVFVTDLGNNRVQKWRPVRRQRP
jgi:hypothetical protein